MAILDKLLTFSDGQAITTTAISDVIDRGANAPTLANFAPGFGGELYLVVQTGTAFSGGTSVDFRLSSSSTADLATATRVHASTGPKVTADLTANKVIAVLPVPPDDYARYIGMQYVVVGTYVAGTIRTHLTNAPGFYRKMASENPQARN